MSSLNLVKTQSVAPRELTPKELENKIARVLIVGNGPVGMKAAELLLAKNDSCEVIVFGDETGRPYNRVQLSQYLAGEVSEKELVNSLSEKTHRLTECLGRKIVSINKELRYVTDDLGNQIQYSKLILATGSYPVIPQIDNVNLHGVHQFRTLNDTKSLLIQKNLRKSFYIVGGGPLGLETALALKTPNNQVTLEVRSNFLSCHFNETAQEILKDYINASGIHVIQKNPLKNILGKERVESVELTDGQVISCDCLIFCAGIKPQTKLARDSQLAVRNGVIVDKYMQTSASGVYAIGECCEFEFATYGVVAPGFKQAKVCVEHIYGNLDHFKKEEAYVKVKFSDYTTAYYGELDVKKSEVFTYCNRLKGVYRQLMLKNNRLLGAIVVGNWNEESEIKSLIADKNKIRTKDLKRFESEGVLYRKKSQRQIKELPEDYIICLCQGVTRGTLSSEIRNGCRTVGILGEKTGAGTVCGSCKPLLMNLLDTPAPNLVMRHQKSILYTSVLSIFAIIVTVFFQPLSITDSVQWNWHVEKLWFDHFWKQVSGYSLLGMCLIATALVLRKRWKRFNFGHVDNWRFAHSIIGMGAIIILMIHTGMRLGSNLNFVLMIVFLAATTTGSLVGVFMARNHHWSDLKLRKHRLWWSRIHYSLLWMLPPLLGFHILSAYYF